MLTRSGSKKGEPTMLGGCPTQSPYRINYLFLDPDPLRSSKSLRVHLPFLQRASS
jgi:hypothetical protein